MREVIQMARTSFGKGDVLFGDGTQGPHEAGRLALEIAKARQVLRFQPRWGLAESVGRTIDWYRQQAEGLNPRELCLADIADYEASL